MDRRGSVGPHRGAGPDPPWVRQGIRRRPQWGAMHAVTNPRILIEGDEATGTWYLLDCVTHAQENALKVLGVYDETYRRVDGTWRMSSMTLRFNWGENVGHVTPDNPMRILPRAEG